MTLLRTAFAGQTGEQVWLPTYAFLVVGTLLVVLAVWAAPRTGAAGLPADSDPPVDGKDAG